MEEDTGCQDRNGTLVPLEEFSFDNDLMGCVFLAVLRNLSFDGSVVRKLCVPKVVYSTTSHLVQTIRGLERGFMWGQS